MNKKSLSAITALILAISGTMSGCGISISGSASKKKIAEDFVEAINNKDYAQAESMLTFAETDKPDGSFSSFASNRLHNLSYDITNDDTENNSLYVTLTSDTDVFDVRLIPMNDSYSVVADDFVTEYKVRYLSCFSSAHNDFKGNGRYIGNGIKEYTKCIYRTDSITFNYDMILEQISLTPNVKATVKFGSDGFPSEVTAVNFLDDSDSMNDCVSISDRAVSVDTYYITEEYAEKLAGNFCSVMSDMFDYAFAGKTYEEFCSSTWNRSLFNKDSQSVKTAYESWVTASKYLSKNYDYAFEGTSMTYDRSYRLGSRYDMTVTLKFNSYYNNGSLAKSGESVEMPVSFIPDEDKFVIESMDDQY